MNNQKTKKKAKKTKKSVPGFRLASRPNLSHCSSLYLKALSNPFGGFAQPPCIPDVVSMPSYKVRAQARGQFFIGLQGVGFIDMRPFVPYSDQIVAQATSLNYNNNFYINVPDPNLFGINNDSPYATTTPGLFREFRLVGAGVKIRYIGTELNRSGRVILYRQPGRTLIPNATNGSTFLSNRSAATAPSTRNEEAITYIPASPQDLFYVTGAAAFQGATLLIYIDGAVPGTSYEFECVQYFEFIGTNLPMTTKSHSDPVGMAAVTQSIPPRVSSAPPAVAEANMFQRALSSMDESASGMINFIMPGTLQGNPVASFDNISTLAGMYLGGGMGGHQQARLQGDNSNYLRLPSSRQTVRIDEID